MASVQMERTYCVHSGENEYNQSKLMFSGHFSSFSSFMSILVLIENVTRLFLSTIWLNYVAARSNNK